MWNAGLHICFQAFTMDAFRVKTESPLLKLKPQYLLICLPPVHHAKREQTQIVLFFSLSFWSYARPRMTRPTMQNYCFPKDIRTLTQVCCQTTPRIPAQVTRYHKTISHLPFPTDQITWGTLQSCLQAANHTDFTLVWRKNFHPSPPLFQSR